MGRYVKNSLLKLILIKLVRRKRLSRRDSLSMSLINSMTVIFSNLSSPSPWLTRYTIHVSLNEEGRTVRSRKMGFYYLKSLQSVLLTSKLKKQNFMFLFSITISEYSLIYKLAIYITLVVVYELMKLLTFITFLFL